MEYEVRGTLDLLDFFLTLKTHVSVSEQFPNGYFGKGFFGHIPKKLYTR